MSVWESVWSIGSTVVTVASVVATFIPASATGWLGVVRDVIRVAALAVGHAKAASPATPSPVAVVEDIVVATANAVTK